MSNSSGIAAEQLRSYIERVERIEEEIKVLQEDRKQVYQEARYNGFDARTMREIVKLRKLDADERAEREALLDIYMAALGMLSDTPLGEAAIQRLSRKPEPAPKADAPAADDAPNSAEPEPEPPAPVIDPGAIAEARDMGLRAGSEGKPVTDNPFPARDARRAAWDEGWCQGSGSDGMDIPEAWRPTKRPKKPGAPPEPKP